MKIGHDDFARVDIRAGTVVRCEIFAEAHTPAYKMWIDFGPDIGEKKTSAQVARHYDAEELVGRQVAAVINFPAKQIGPLMSEVLVLGFPDGQGEVVLIGPDLAVADGVKLF